MKKVIVFILALLMLPLAACAVPSESQETVFICEHQQTAEKFQAAEILIDGYRRICCEACGEILEETIIPATKSLKILAVGNSFSDDATAYLYDLFKAAGVDDVIVGNAYIGGCSIEKHYQMAQSGKASYTYTKYIDGEKIKTPSVPLIDMIVDEGWDIITVQQASKQSGLPEMYKDLPNLIDYILDNCTNPSVDINFHMTWAYEQTTTNAGFANYNNDQMTMYNAIINTVQNTVLKQEEITRILPAGTAIQNLRTSYLGDTLTRDGYHLSYDLGRYTAGLTWVCSITGISPYEINWVPSSYAAIADDLDAIQEAVANAVSTMFSVTQSSIMTKKEITVEERFVKAGLDINDYELLDWEPKQYYCWNASSSLKASKNSSLPQFTSSKKFIKAELPNGTVIVVDDGYKYRPDGWEKIDEPFSGTRPSATTTPFLIIDEAWWDSFNFRAFNISKETGSAPATADDATHFRIYVRKDRIIPSQEEITKALTPTKSTTTTTTTTTTVSASHQELFAKAGLNINDYNLIDWQPKLLYHWNSTSSTKTTSIATLPQFIASKKFTKDELPIGTVIIVDKGYKYRPDGWQAIDQPYSGKRPSATTTQFLIIDEAWWGEFNYRAFNVSKESGSEPATNADIEHFKIYVPKK